MNMFEDFRAGVAAAIAGAVLLAGSASAMTIVKGSFEDVSGITGSGSVANGTPLA